MIVNKKFSWEISCVDFWSLILNGCWLSMITGTGRLHCSLSIFCFSMFGANVSSPCHWVCSLFVAGEGSFHWLKLVSLVGIVVEWFVFTKLETTCPGNWISCQFWIWNSPWTNFWPGTGTVWTKFWVDVGVVWTKFRLDVGFDLISKSLFPVYLLKLTRCV